MSLEFEEPELIHKIYQKDFRNLFNGRAIIVFRNIWMFPNIKTVQIPNEHENSLWIHSF